MDDSWTLRVHKSDGSIIEKTIVNETRKRWLKKNAFSGEVGCWRKRDNLLDYWPTEKHEVAWV
jgi:hypothetical protein